MWHVKFRVLTSTPEPTVILLGSQATTNLLRTLAHLLRRVARWWRECTEAPASSSELRLVIQLHVRRRAWPNASSSAARTGE